MNAYSVVLRRSPFNSYDRGPTTRERTVIAGDSGVAANKALRDAKGSSAYKGWNVAEIKVLPELVR